MKKMRITLETNEISAQQNEKNKTSNQQKRNWTLKYYNVLKSTNAFLTFECTSNASRKNLKSNGRSLNMFLIFQCQMCFTFVMLKCAPASFWISWPAGWLPGYFKIHTLVMDFSSFHLSKETVDLFNSYKSDFQIRPFPYVSQYPVFQNGIRFARPGGFFFRSATRTKETYSTGRPSDIGPSLVQNGPIPKWRYRKNVSNKSASQNQIFGGDPLGARQVSASDTAVRNTVRRSSTKSG